MAKTRKPAPRRGRPTDPSLAARRRGEILAAATALFAERGYPNTDLQVVADKIGVGKGTIYRYFPSKRDLFLAVVDLGMNALRAAVDAAAAQVEDPLEKIRRALHRYLEFFDTHPEVAELIIQERAHFKRRKKPTYFAHRDANIGPWQALLRDLIAQGRVRDMPVEAISDTLSNLVYGTMFTNLFAGRPASLDAQAENLLDVVFHGLLPRTSTPPALEAE